MPAPFLAVVVPAYNEEDRIAASLESLADYLSKQSYTWEIVVADDGSSDDLFNEEEMEEAEGDNN